MTENEEAREKRHIVLNAEPATYTATVMPITWERTRTVVVRNWKVFALGVGLVLGGSIAAPVLVPGAAGMILGALLGLGGLAVPSWRLVRREIERGG